MAQNTDIAALDEDVRDTLRLVMVPGVGPRLRAALLERFKTPQAVFAAAPSELRNVAGIGTKLCQSILNSKADSPEIDDIVLLCRQHNIDLLSDHSSEYPARLREIPDPPGVLFAQGRLEPRDAVAVAIVGSRHATHYGLTQAERLAASLARAGLTIISGLARGIDAAAHLGAIGAGGRTVAVLGSGLLNIYPPEHQQLSAQVAQAGALLSEQPPRFRPIAGVFPQRNRIISGMSLGVIVVEASERSGALITAQHAMEQGREVFAVPGRVDSRMSRGCHRLLREGAKLVESADDVLAELGPLPAPAISAEGTVIHHPAELMLNEPEQQVLAAIRSDATQIDEVVAVAGLPVPQVLATLSVLEMRRLIRRLSGSTVLRL